MEEFNQENKNIKRSLEQMPQDLRKDLALNLLKAGHIEPVLENLALFTEDEQVDIAVAIIKKHGYKNMNEILKYFGPDDPSNMKRKMVIDGLIDNGLSEKDEKK